MKQNEFHELRNWLGMGARVHDFRSKVTVFSRERGGGKLEHDNEEQ